MLTFASGDSQATVDPAAGGRLASLIVHGHELLVGPEVDALRWGGYPMVPFAGRIRRGSFTFGGVDHILPANLGPHAIHGYGYMNEWRVVDDETIAWTFASPWPYAGEATQRFVLGDDHLTLTMTARAGERQPLMLGWHPWFRRHIGMGRQAELSFGPAQMYELDDEAIPTGALIEPPEGPWDNCFTELGQSPEISWGDALRLRLSSSAPHWVIYTEPPHAICVEPQTGAPDAVNRVPEVVEAGEEMAIEFTLAWG